MHCVTAGSTQIDEQTLEVINDMRVISNYLNLLKFRRVFQTSLYSLLVEVFNNRLYRCGNRYSENLCKVAGILILVPAICSLECFLPLIGANGILLLNKDCELHRFTCHNLVYNK